MSYLFGYPSPKKRRLPLSWTRVPDFDDLAQMLAAEYATKLGTASSIAFVTHSQGGLILQRFLAWMISEGRGRELARIGTVIMLACPNGGSQYLASICHALGYGRHPQAANLEVLNKQVPDAQRVVLARVVHASFRRRRSSMPNPIPRLRRWLRRHRVRRLGAGCIPRSQHPGRQSLHDPEPGHPREQNR